MVSAMDTCMHDDPVALRGMQLSVTIAHHDTARMVAAVDVAR